MPRLALFLTLWVSWLPCQILTNKTGSTYESSNSLNRYVLISQDLWPVFSQRYSLFPSLQTAHEDLIKAYNDRNILISGLERQVAAGNNQLYIQASSYEARIKQGQAETRRAILIFTLSALVAGAGLAVVFEGLIRNESVEVSLGAAAIIASVSVGIVIYFSDKPRI